MPQSNGIEASGIIKDFYIDEIVQADLNNYQQQYNILKKWIYDNRNEIFNFLPTSFPDSDNFEINIEQD